MRWYEVIVWTGQEAVDSVSEIFSRLGAAGVVIEDPSDLTASHVDRYGEIYDLSAEDFPEYGVRVKGYFAKGDSYQTLSNQIQQELQKVASFGIDIGEGVVHITEVDEEDWAHAWKAYYKPVAVSEHFTIKPTWEEYTPTAGERVIELDPGMAFGTGTHPTTTLCMQLLEKYVKPGDQVVDVGAGTGILSIAAAKIGAAYVLALDLDPVAVNVSSDNVRLNHVEDQVEVRQADLLQGVEGSFDVIVSNILAHVIISFLPDVHRVLKSEGVLILSGIIDEKEDAVQRALLDNHIDVLETHKEQEWVAVVAKLSSAKG